MIRLLPHHQHCSQSQFYTMPIVFLAQSPKENASLKCLPMRVVPAISTGETAGGRSGRTPWVVKFASVSNSVQMVRAREARGSSVWMGRGGESGWK